MFQEITPIKDLFNNKIALDSKVTVAGWVRTRRDSKAGFSFLNIHDGSCFPALQIVVPDTLANYDKDVLRLSAGCSVIVRGTLLKSPAKGQVYELHAEEIDVKGFVEDPDTYPITPKYHTLEYLREHPHLRPRTNVIGACTRVSHCLAQAIHRFFDERGFYWIRTPIITASDCEGAGELFQVTSLDLANLPRKENKEIDFSEDYFGHEAFLAVSGQLHAEAYCEALSKVYTFGPTFRAENSNTSRHLSEFWMLEPEVAFADLHDIARLAAELVQYLAKTVLEECPQDMAFFAERINKDAIRRLEKLISSDFVRIEYSEAIAILEKADKKFIFPVKWGADLQSEHERYLAEEYFDAPVIVMNYPKDIKSFYMRLNDDGKTVAAMDILAPGIGEITGGSQREERLDFLEKRIEELGLNKECYHWYLDLRRYGTVPHAGFGLGFERFLVYITGIANIRDTIPSPRTPKHARF